MRPEFQRQLVVARASALATTLHEVGSWRPPPDLTIEVVMRARTGGTIARYPISIRYADGI